jgi:uncharacterized phage protein gp47/JayE
VNKLSIVIKEKDQLVSDVIARLQASLGSNTDFSDGSTLKTIIESLMEEMDIQYWQLEQAYNSGHIDDTIDADLDKLVALLGIIRNPASNAIGTVTFSRSTAAIANYFIPAGTLVQTLKDASGISVQFTTLNNATLLSGNSTVDVNVSCTQSGLIGNIAASTISIINTPANGIESVTNSNPMSGGEEIESDTDLRERTKHILDTSGLGTVDALKFKIKIISGVKEVSVVDLARGIGTVDIIVLTDTIPMITDKRNEINTIIAATKAAGIDIVLSEPAVVSINVSVALTLLDGYIVSDLTTIVTTAITDYINNLDIGQTLILNQLRKSILNSSVHILDINISTPTVNTTVPTTSIIRTGTITIT